MDSLFAKADAIRPAQKRRKREPKNGRPPSKGKGKGKETSFAKENEASGSKTATDDPTALSVKAKTSLPPSLRPSEGEEITSKKFTHIKNKKLRLQLDRKAEHNARSKALREDSRLLTDAIGADGGQIEAEGPLEKTWRLSQEDIVREVGLEAARGRKEWALDGGPYRSRYTRNGRHLGIVGKNGHVASFDWQTGNMHAELQLRETCRDFTYLHDHTHFAVAQKKYVFIYDQNGVELHKLTNHVEPTRLEFLPFHWLLASVGNTGCLKYQDTSTGQVVTEHRTGLGACNTLAQNTFNAVLHLGHANGTVTLWTPNLPHPAVRLLAHLGPVSSIAMDPAQGSAGRYMATAGVDGHIKIWDCRSWTKPLREWTVRSGGGGGAGVSGPEVDFSQKGHLAVASGGYINVYTPPTTRTPHPTNPSVAPPLYLTHPNAHRPLTGVRFCPFHDVLTVGHSKGLSSILVPGSGEPHFDSSEADPFENRKARREREVRGLLDKIQPDMISLDASFVGALEPSPKQTLPGGEGVAPEVPFSRMTRIDRLRASGNYDNSSEKDDEQVAAVDTGATGPSGAKKKGTKQEKMKMRGKNKSTKRYLRKHRKNVIDPKTEAIRAKLEKQREERRKEEAKKNGKDTEPDKKSALDRFRRGKVAP